MTDSCARTSLLLLAVSLAIGCPAPEDPADAGHSTTDGGTDAGPVVLGEAAARVLINDYCAAVHGRLCAGMIACECPLESRGLEEATCAQVRTAACVSSLTERVLEDLAEGRSRLDPARLASCTTALDAMTADCNVLPETNLPVECESALVDAAAVGASCTIQGGGMAFCAGGAGVCAPGSTTATCLALPLAGVACLGGELCGPGLVCDNGDCRVPGGADATCLTDRACAAGLACNTSGKCQAPASAFAACERDEQCVAGSLCDEGTCQAPVAIGTLCTGPRVCGAGRSCVRAPETRTCGDAAGLDAACDSATPCAAGLACQEARCRPLPVANEECLDGWLCAPGFSCGDGERVCHRLPDVDEPCLSGDRFCADGLGCDTDTNTCKAAGGEGAACLLNPPDNVCAPGFGCSFEDNGSFCRALGGAGTSCTSDRTCASGFYCGTGDKCAARQPIGGACPNGNECAEDAECVRTGEIATCRAIPGRNDPCIETCADGLACVGAGGRCAPNLCTVP